MFSPEIVHSDDFLNMPAESRLLYYDLGMSADDEGLITPMGLIRKVQSSVDSLVPLFLRGFIIPLTRGVIAIRHWKSNNFIRKDRFVPSVWQEERKLLESHGDRYELAQGVSVDFTAWLTNGQPIIEERQYLGQPVVNLVRELDSKIESTKNDQEMSEEAERIKNEISESFKKRNEEMVLA